MIAAPPPPPTTINVNIGIIVESAEATGPGVLGVKLHLILSPTYPKFTDSRFLLRKCTAWKELVLKIGFLMGQKSSLPGLARKLLEGPWRLPLSSPPSPLSFPPASFPEPVLCSGMFRWGYSLNSAVDRLKHLSCWPLLPLPLFSVQFSFLLLQFLFLSSP